MNGMKTLCGDIKEADNEVVDMAQKSIKERLAKILMNLYDTFGINEDKSLKIQLSRDELTSMTETTTESCIRLLSDFRKLGMIELIDQKITLIDISKLKRVKE
jgi:CRP-like cAMP-binding protein